MASLSDVTTTADAFGKTQYGLGVTEGKRQQSAIDDPIIADLKTQIGSTTPPPTTPPTPPPVTPSPTPTDIHEAVDFAQQTTGWAPRATGITGKGVDVTVYRIKTLSSTHKAAVDALVPYNTNPYEVLRFFSSTSMAATNPDISYFTVQGTNQNHPYNGIQVGYSTGAHIHHLKITGIPGFSSSPPGETMLLSLWHADNAVVEDVVIDGRVDGVGTTGIAATLFGQNYVKNPTFRRCTAQYAGAGFGSATFECVGESWTDSVFSHNRKHLNIERTFGGTFHYTRCKFSGASVPYVAQVSTDPAYGSAKVIFEDCTVDGDGILRVRVYGPSSVNSQKDADIRCIKNGVDVTGDPTKFLLARSG